MKALEYVALAVVVFLTSATYDWCNANYIKANSDDSPIRTSLWSGATASFGLVGLAGMLAVSVWYVVPEILGFMAGSYLAVAMRLRRKSCK